jgi:hypothetical protein
MDHDARRRRRREPYLLDSVGGSGVQSGTLPVPSMTNNQSESAKEKVCLNNNIGDSPKRKKKEDACKIQDETRKKDPSNEKEDRPESGIELDDNVMQVDGWIHICHAQCFLSEKGLELDI